LECNRKGEIKIFSSIGIIAVACRDVMNRLIRVSLLLLLFCLSLELFALFVGVRRPQNSANGALNISMRNNLQPPASPSTKANPQNVTHISFTTSNLSVVLASCSFTVGRLLLQSMFFGYGQT
jgi:hypothetical protein